MLGNCQYGHVFNYFVIKTLGNESLFVIKANEIESEKKE